MKGHNISDLKDYLDRKGYNVAFASEDEIIKMYEDDQMNYLNAKKKVEKNDTRK